jgi:hypothetical protein
LDITISCYYCSYSGKPTSDHTPCIISVETTIPGRKIFRFESFRVAHPGFQQIVSDSWNKHVYKKNSAATLNAKFKRLRYDLKHWSKSISKLPICIENCNQAIAEIDKMEENRTLSIPEVNFRKVLKVHLARLLSYQHDYWKKRCTIRWTKFGDENSKTFQEIATERHRRNYVASLLLSDGNIVTEHKDKEEIIFQTYKDRLGSCSTPQMEFDLPPLITPIPGLEELSIPFTKQEIDDVIKYMPMDKAPGPDGFNGLFLKSCWSTIKVDIYALCFSFYEGNLELESINMGYITLIQNWQTLKELMITGQSLY